MPYQLTHTAWLDREKARAAAVLTVQLEKDTAYTVAEILAILADCGLTYNNPEYAEIGAELIADGLIEQV